MDYLDRPGNEDDWCEYTYDERYNDGVFLYEDGELVRQCDSTDVSYARDPEYRYTYFAQRLEISRIPPPSEEQILRDALIDQEM